MLWILLRQQPADCKLIRRNSGAFIPQMVLFFLSRRTDRAARAEPSRLVFCQVAMEEDDSQMAEMAEISHVPYLYSVHYIRTSI